jgi:isopentenyl-diphosphate delta-isomerase
MQIFRQKTSKLNTDPSSEERKKDHIQLAFQSQQDIKGIDPRFYYEPILSGHPSNDQIASTRILGTEFQYPIWVSSMTGGTKMAAIINKNLAIACEKYNLGMGLGSCRSLLYSDDAFADFNVRKFIGDRPLYANLGIAQVEELVEHKKYDSIKELVDRLNANGLIMHINPLQEWTQPEGDRYYKSPLETISKILDNLDISIIVKEVGQGMGIESLKALMQLPLTAIDFAANGGTNFSKLELLRCDEIRKETLMPIVNVGHSAKEMVSIVNNLLVDLGSKAICKEFIVSGGVKDFLDGYYHISKMKSASIYGQASGFLRHARGSYEELDRYVSLQVEGLKMAYAFLRIKT